MSTPWDKMCVVIIRIIRSLLSCFSLNLYELFYTLNQTLQQAAKVARVQMKTIPIFP